MNALTFKPANILTPSLHRGARVESPEQLAEIFGRAAPVRVDIYRSKTGAAQIGAAWSDGSTFITDASHWGRLTFWVSAQIGAGRVKPSEVRQHLGD